MSRAYCLTCNEHVHETPSGTCPLGHPVAADGYGPEPWVGFAGDTETDVAEVQMQHLDTSGRPREHASVGQHVNGTPHVNGAANGSANGHRSSNGHGSLTSSSVPFPPVNGSGNGSHDGSDRPASSDLASDDLTALLADALRENVPDEQPAGTVDEAHTPVEDTTPAAAASPVADKDADADWGDLASLAAELHLDEHVATDDGPRAPEPAPPAPAPQPEPPAPADEAPEGELSASSIDDLLAELTGGTPDAAPPVAEAPAEAPRAPEPPTADDVAAWDTPPPPTPPAPPVAPPPPVASPPPPPTAPADDTDIWDAPAPADGVGSAPAADPADIWAQTEPAPAEESTPAPVVDLSNFTARGKRVGDAGSALPTRKKRGRKR